MSTAPKPLPILNINLLKAQFAKLEELVSQPLIKRMEGDYWEEDENGVMWLRRKDGTPVLMMPKADYEAMKEHKP